MGRTTSVSFMQSLTWRHSYILPHCIPVSDDGHHNVEHNEGAEEDEGHEVDVGDDGPASLLRVGDVELAVLCVVPAVGARVAGPVSHRRHHDIWPGFASWTPSNNTNYLNDFFRMISVTDNDMDCVGYWKNNFPMNPHVSLSVRRSVKNSKNAGKLNFERS